MNNEKRIATHLDSSNGVRLAVSTFPELTAGCTPDVMDYGEPKNDGNPRANTYFCPVRMNDRQTREKRDRLRQFCKDHGWTVSQEWLDDDSDCPVEFHWMLEHAKERRFDVLAFWSLGDLTNQGIVKNLRYLEKLERYGVRSYSLIEA